MSLKPKTKKRNVAKKTKGQLAMDEERMALMKQRIGLDFAKYGDEEGKQRMFAEARAHTKRSQELSAEFQADIKKRDESARKKQAKKYKIRTGR